MNWGKVLLMYLFIGGAALMYSVDTYPMMSSYSGTIALSKLSRL